MSSVHKGNTQPAIDQEEHEHTVEPATKRVLVYGYDGSSKQILKTNTDGELVVSTGGGEQALQLDDVSTTSVTYVGVAPIGTATSSASWQIKKIDESGTPITLTIKWAGSGAYTQIWDNRTSLTYA